MRRRYSVARIARALLVVPLLLVCALLVIRHRHQDVDWNALVKPLDDLTIVRDIPYAEGDRHTLDVYASKTAVTKRPTIIFIYGGTWISGQKEDVAFVGASFARQGYLVVIPDYRIYPKTHWPSFLQENAAAVKWAHDHAAQYGGNSNALILIGHSAGALNALSLALDRRWLVEQGLDPSHDLKAVIGIAGPYNMYPDTPELWDVLGPKERLPDIWPINHVDGHGPPVLLLVGSRDHVAGSEDSRLLAAKINSKGGEVTLVSFRLGHGALLTAVVPRNGKPSRELRTIENFIKLHVQAASTDTH
jgi:acetyl esterase/lipase